MRRVSLWLLSTLAVVVLLFSYRTSTGSSASSTVAVAAAPTDSQSGSSAPTGATKASGTSRTIKGSTVSTQWGDIQVAITVTGRKITAVDVPVYPNGNPRDEEINSVALPTLKQETLTAQSAKIDTVSGATVTSDGYLQSLQSAIDAAHL